MLGAWAIRRYLMIRPRAEVIKLTVSGQVQEMKVARGQSLAKIGESIAAVSPEVIELFDGQGKLIRAMRPETDGESTIEQPKPPAVLQSDPETARFTHMAGLLAKAYEHTTNVAFDKMVQLVERFEARCEAIESRLERTEGLYRREREAQLSLLQSQAMAALRDAEDGDGDDDEEISEESMLRQMMAAFMQGRAKAKGEKTKSKTNGSSNGNGAAASPPDGKA